jgi:hypothetical protein
LTIKEVSLNIENDKNKKRVGFSRSSKKQLSNQDMNDSSIIDLQIEVPVRRKLKFDEDYEFNQRNKNYSVII